MASNLVREPIYAQARDRSAGHAVEDAASRLRLRAPPLARLAGAILALLAFALLSMAPTAQAGDPPVANINAPANNTVWEAGKPVIFSGSLSFDPDQNVTTYSMYYRWEFPTETLEGVDLKVVNYTNFTAPGVFVVRLTVVDEELLEGYDDVTVRIIPANEPPVAVIASPTNGSRFFTTDLVGFSGAGSSDPEGGPLAYTWILDGSSQLGTGQALSVKLPQGTHAVTLRVQDDRGAEGTAWVLVVVAVNTPPRLVSPYVDPFNGTGDEDYTFAVTYFEDNGEEAVSVLLALDGAFYPMVRQGTETPQEGVLYSATLRPPAGSHAFYMLASDGNFTNVSLTVDGPTVWEPVTLLASDGLGVLEVLVVPPHNLTFEESNASLPPPPAGLLPLSAAYTLAGGAVDAATMQVTVSLAFSTAATRSSAALYALAPNGTEWLGLVSETDDAHGTVTVQLAQAALPVTLRAFAAPRGGAADAPPTLAIAHTGLLEPHALLAFDAVGSSDPEGADVIFSWRFTGPSLDTGWVSGERVEIAFPRGGTYAVSLRGEDGAGNTAYRNVTVQIVEVIPPDITPPDEGVVIASLAVAVAVSAVLAVWWRSRTPAPARTYDDLYGRAYKGRMWDEREYAELFRKFADAPATDEPPAEPAPAPEAEKLWRPH